MTTMKWLTPPELVTRGDRGYKLSLHAKKRPDGKSQDYRVAVEGTRKVILWRFTVRSADGCKTFWAESRADAERLAEISVAELIAKRDGTAQAASKSTERTVSELAQHLLEVRRGKNSATRDATVAGYARDLDRFILPHFGTLHVADVKPEDVDRWAAKYNAEGSARTRQKRVILLGMLFRLAVTDGWRGTSPILQRHRVRVLKVGQHVGKLKGDQRVAQVLSTEELTTIVEQLDANDPALRLLVQLTGRVGLRLREVTHLRLDDVDVDRPDGTAFIRVASGFACSCRDCKANEGTRLTKSGKARLVPVPPDLVDACRKHADTLRAKFGAKAWFAPVWRSKPRQRSRPGALRVPSVLSGSFGAAAAEAGRPDVIFHDLRATAKTALLMSGANATAVDVAMGHQLPGMSAIYVTLESSPALLYKGCYPEWEPKLTVVKKAKSA